MKDTPGSSHVHSTQQERGGEMTELSVRHGWDHADGVKASFDLHL